MKSFLISSAVIITMVYIIMVGWLYMNQQALLYHPDTNTPSPAAAGFTDMAVVHYETSDGLRLFGWYKEATPGRPTVVYFHGNAGSLLNHSWIAHPLIEAGLGVLLVEYRGYGGNPGSPTEDGLYADGRAGIEYLKGIGLEEDNLILFGQSLGTGVAVKMASEYAPQALVLQSPYLSIAKTGQHHYWYMPVTTLIRDQFPAEDYIGGITIPLLVLVAENDTIIPPKMSHDLFALANDPKTLLNIKGAGHNDLGSNGGLKAVLDFLKEF